ncbi:hypothetical protein QBC32DRAFT_212050 [Pseudoneurospora amorphoporcata]|uniref:Uncharacterized protein n=1 Tax=Pseudoneurospora amorphoporcata TaxID=241081 RepID=A0AAN6NVL0_9PEZI|nr:hypothetical protein QBC32DRAFT_212050 [Pseudoneurospora amorphoporcata]
MHAPSRTSRSRPHYRMSCLSSSPIIPRVENKMSTLSALTSVGLAPLNAFVAAPLAMQQAMMIWKACTATDPMQEDEDDRAARADFNGNILTPIMVVASIVPTEATTPAPTQLTMTLTTTTADFEPRAPQAMNVSKDQVHYTITAVETVVEYEPIEAILTGIDEPKNKAIHARTDSSSSTSSTTSNVSTQMTDSNWSNSTSSTSATDVSHTQETKDSLKKQKSVEHPIHMDNDIQVFSVTNLDLPPGPVVISDIDTTTIHKQEEPLGHGEESAFDHMARFEVDGDEIPDARWNEIMIYEANRQRKEKRGPKVHCREVFFHLPLTSPSNWQPGSDILHEALEGMDTQLESDEYSSIHLDTLPPFGDEIEGAVQSETTRAATPKKFKIRCAQKAPASTSGAPIRKFQIGGNISQSSGVQHKRIPQIIVTEPIEPPTSPNDHTKTVHNQATPSSFLEVPSQQNGFDTFTRSLQAPVVSELDFEKGNFAPSSPRRREEWLNKWAEKGCATRRRATMRTIDVPTAKEAMRVQDKQVFLPPITTETPRVRQLNNYGEDYFLMTPYSTASSELGKWSEEKEETFEDLFEQVKEEEKGMINQPNKNSIAPEHESSSSRYDITYHFDELYQWENEGKTVKKGRQEEQEVHRNEAIKNRASNLKTDKPTSTGKASAAEDHGQTALVADMCHKWGPYRFDRWCEEYATPISEAMWNGAGIGLKEFTGANSEPALELEEIVQTPRRHSFPIDNPPRKYLRTRRSLELKEDVLTQFRLMRWTEGRDNMQYDEDFESHE